MSEVELRESRIGGNGVFTCGAVPAGEHIRDLVVAREITSDAPLRPEAGERPEHAFLADGRFLLVASPDCYFNHSCDPNAYLRFEERGIGVIARRDVAAGEELTIDYLINNSGGESWDCHCGAARCRGRTGRSFFDLPIAIQREYLPLLAPWFRRRHAAELADL